MLSKAKPRAGVRWRSDAAAPRCARGSLRCSISWPAEFRRATAPRASQRSRPARPTATV